MFAFGWKKTLTTAMPGSDCDSMCSMSFTSVVKPRSAFGRDAVLDLLRRQARESEHEADDRNVDVRKDVRRRPQASDTGVIRMIASAMTTNV